MGNEQDPKRYAINHQCPTCAAEPGEKCKPAEPFDQGWIGIFHQQRVLVATREPATDEGLMGALVTSTLRAQTNEREETPVLDYLDGLAKKIGVAAAMEVCNLGLDETQVVYVLLKVALQVQSSIEHSVRAAILEDEILAANVEHVAEGDGADEENQQNYGADGSGGW